MDALALPMMEWGIHPRDITFDDYSNWDGVRMKLESLQVRCPFKTIVVDSITSGSDAINRQTLKVKANDNTGKRIAGIPVNSIEDFNAEDSCLKELVALTKDIAKFHKVNVILIAHVIQKEIKSSDGKTHMSRTLVTAGKGIAQKIPAYCSEVYHFNIKQGAIIGAGGQYSLLTTHTGDDFARTSLRLPDEIIFGNKPLYPEWIEPAINKMNAYADQNQPTDHPTPPPTTNVSPFVQKG